MSKVLVTGGAGYIGSVLCPQLLRSGYQVIAFDTCYFGKEFLPFDHSEFRLIQGDIRDVAALREALEGVAVVVHLACISNDASFELDEQLSTTINMDAFEPLVQAAREAGVQRFVYASSSSVYGVSEHPDVKEDHPLVPLTLYNRYKGLCEPLLWKHTDADFVGVVFRPATVCGYAPRQRLDLSVNILSHQAFMKRQIQVFGGTQMRPNLHVQDYCAVVELLMNAAAEKIADETFNVGMQNMSIGELAQVIKKVVEEEFPHKAPIEIVTVPSDDTRSYRINSDKIARVLGFRPQYSIEDAVRELCHAFASGKLPNSMEDDRYYNVRTLKQRNIT